MRVVHIWTNARDPDRQHLCSGFREAAEGEVQAETSAADCHAQQVKQHVLSLLYREESSLQTGCCPFAAAAALPAGKQHRHVHLHGQTHTCAQRHMADQQARAFRAHGCRDTPDTQETFNTPTAEQRCTNGIYVHGR